MRNATVYSLLLSILTLGASCGDSGQPSQEAAETEKVSDATLFIDEYSTAVQHLFATWQQDEWAASTQIGPRHATLVRSALDAKQSYEAYVGSLDVSSTVGRLLGQQRSTLTPLEERQLERILQLANQFPVSEMGIRREIENLEVRQVNTLRAFDYQYRGNSVSLAEIEDILTRSIYPQKRRDAWEAAMAPGELLKVGTGDLRNRRNQVARDLGHSDWMTYQAANDGFRREQLMEQLQSFNSGLRPLYRELHTWARHELAAKYGQPVPDQLPIEWLPSLWGEDWTLIAPPSATPAIEEALADQTPQQMVRSAEAFFTSMGFEPLPAQFWARSSLGAVNAGDENAKLGGASAWHVDLDSDVRLLMNIEPTPFWYDASHREISHIYYYLAYSQPDVPLILRDGANRSFHDAIAGLTSFAANRPSYLRSRSLLAADTEVDEIQLLLKEALDYVVFMSFAGGTMSNFEDALYAEHIPVDQINTRWWQMVLDYQGIQPPETRSEQWGDGLTKVHLQTRPGRYYEYAVSTALMFQFHHHIAVEILGQEPHHAHYGDSLETGSFLQNLMNKGATNDWEEIVAETTGDPLSIQPMVMYFDPVYTWLLEQNEGREYTLPNLPFTQRR